MSCLSFLFLISHRVARKIISRIRNNDSKQTGRRISSEEEKKFYRQPDKIDINEGANLIHVHDFSSFSICLPVLLLFGENPLNRHQTHFHKIKTNNGISFSTIRNLFKIIFEEFGRDMELSRGLILDVGAARLISARD